jgi:hypothetical protein
MTSYHVGTSLKEDKIYLAGIYTMLSVTLGVLTVLQARELQERDMKMFWDLSGFWTGRIWI